MAVLAKNSITLVSISFVKSRKTEYYVSTSNTELVNGSWATTFDGVDDSNYLWEREKQELNDGTSVYTDPHISDIFNTLHQNIVKNKDDTSQALDELASTTQASIDLSKEGIIQEVSETYYSKDDVDKVVNEAYSEIKQQADNIAITVKELKENDINGENGINAKIDDLKNSIDDTNKHFNFSSMGLIISNSEIQKDQEVPNGKYMLLDDDNFLMRDNNTTVAKIADGDFYIMTSLGVGNFAFVPRENGSLDFKKVK